MKSFVSPITTKPWGKHIPQLAEKDLPNKDAHANNKLYGEPTYLKTGKVPVSDTGIPLMEKIGKLKQGVYY